MVALFFALNFSLLTLNCGANEDGAAFLKIDVGARAIGMGGAHTALADDVNAPHWNPAGVAAADRRQATASHADWFAGLSHEHAAYLHPRLFGGNAAVSVTSLRSGQIEGRDAARRAAGSFTSADTAVTLSYGKTQGDARLGMSVKFIEQRLGARRAQGAALDLGLIHPLPLRALSLGLAAQNLGPRLAYGNERSYDLPALLKAGVGYSPSKAFTTAVDVKYQIRPGEMDLAWGAEFRAVQALALRAGYRLPMLNGPADVEGSLGKMAGFQGGFGLALGKDYQLDYAVLPFGELGNTQRLSFTAKF